MANLQNPVKAIRAKCLDCCCGSSNEVKLCTAENCALFPFRFGTNPYRKKREISHEQRELMRQNLAYGHSNKAISQEKSENSISEG